MKSNIMISIVIILSALFVGAHEYYRVTTILSTHLPIFLKNETQAIALQLEESFNDPSNSNYSNVAIHVFPSISIRIEMKLSKQVRLISATNAHVAPPQWFIDLFMESPVQYQMSLFDENEKLATIYASMTPNAILKETWISYLAGLTLFSALYIFLISVFSYKQRLYDQLIGKLLAAFEQSKEGSFDYQRTTSDDRILSHVLTEFSHLMELKSRQLKSAIIDRNKFESLTQHDELTGLANKQCFHNMMKDKLRNKDGNGGHILLLKLSNLEQINIQLGHQEGDIYISRMANMLNKLCNVKNVEGHVFRNLGSEMLMVILNADDTTIDFLAEELKSYLDRLENESYQNSCGYFSVVKFIPGQKLSELMALLDGNLSQAMAKSHNAYIIAQPQEISVGGLNHWYKIIGDIIDDKSIVLHRTIIKSVNGDVVPYHYDINVSFDAHGERYTAKDVFCAAKRFNLSHKIDQLIITQLVAFLESEKSNDRYAIKVSSGAMVNERFRNWVSHQLSHHQGITNRLVFNIPEIVASEQLELSRLFIHSIHRAGSQIVLECKQQLDVIELIDMVKSLSVNIVKVNVNRPTQVANIQRDHDFITTLVVHVHKMNVPVIAGHIQNSEDWESLHELGVDAAQGALFGKPVIVV